MAPRIIGIDLGTSTTCIAKWKGKPVVLPSSDGGPTTPSYVSFGNEVRVGKAAKDGNPLNTIYNSKRHMGEKLQQLVDDCPVKVDEGYYRVKYRGQDKKVHPVEVAAHLLKKVYTYADEDDENSVGSDDEDDKNSVGSDDEDDENFVVVTVPAYYDQGAREATYAAAKIAGLGDPMLVNEPTAAAMGHMYERASPDQPHLIMVFDLGGGTFDCSIVQVYQGSFEVKATHGNRRLGGEDFVQDLFHTACAKAGPMTDRQAELLRQECEQAKLSLSTEQTYTIRHDGRTLWTLTRSEFEERIAAQLELCMISVDTVLAAAKLKDSQVNEVLLVGGSTRIPKVYNMIASRFDNVTVIPNPDEIVACGAAVMAGSMASVEKLASVALNDVIAKDMGIALYDETMGVIIPRNTRLPAKHTEEYETTKDFQEEVSIFVLEGDEKLARHNRTVDEFTIKIPSMLKGEARVVVTFEVKQLGILEIKANEEAHTIRRTNNFYSRTFIRECVDTMAADLMEGSFIQPAKRVKLM